MSAAPPYWSEADAAELNVIVFALTRGVFRHRERCAACAAAGSELFCKQVDRAIEEALDWRRFRWLLSRAEWLRALQNETDERDVA